MQLEPLNGSILCIFSPKLKDLSFKYCLNHCLPKILCFHLKLSIYVVGDWKIYTSAPQNRKKKNQSIKWVQYSVKQLVSNVRSHLKEQALFQKDKFRLENIVMVKSVNLVYRPVLETFFHCIKLSQLNLFRYEFHCLPYDWRTRPDDKRSLGVITPRSSARNMQKTTFKLHTSWTTADQQLSSHHLSFCVSHLMDGQSHQRTGHWRSYLLPGLPSTWHGKSTFYSSQQPSFCWLSFSFKTEKQLSLMFYKKAHQDNSCHFSR